jgi:hypothetical protein
MKKTLLLLLYVLTTAPLLAQLDSAVFRTFEQQLQIGLFVSDNYATQDFTTANASLTQTANLKPSVGIQLGYGGMLLAVGLGVPLPNYRYAYSATKAVNISGYFSRQKYVLWGAARRFRGFENSDGSLSESKQLGTLAASYMRILQPQRYSFRAAFRQIEHQHKSGGSWLWKSGLQINDWRDDLQTLPLTSLNALQSQGINALGGYGYTLSWGETWYASALALGGVTFQRIYFETPNNQTTNWQLLLPTFDVKGAIGYNAPDFYAALTFSMDNGSQLLDVEDTTIFYQYLKTDLRFGIRIGKERLRLQRLDKFLDKP